jgi:hypothetical protein
MRIERFFVAAVLWVLSPGLCGAQVRGEGMSESAKAAVFDVTEIAAAAALSPEHPEAYLELAEQILDRPDAPERIELARQMLVRAVEYGRSRKGAEHTAASAALALASISPQASQRQWLRAVAATLHPDYSAMRPSDRIDTAASSRAAEAITRLRAGEGIRPRELLADPAVRTVLKQNEAALSADGTTSVSDLDAAAKKQPCTSCGGRLLAMPQGPRSAMLCSACKGQAFLAVSTRDFGSQVRMQLRLLGVPQDRWGDATEAEMLPARDPDAAEIAKVFGVDTTFVAWRDGKWQLPAEAGKSVPAIKPEEASPTVAPAR